MKEFKAIQNAYSKLDFSKNKSALATVVRVRGSSYRSPGARMLISDDGHWTGSISGGCLEGDALRKARKVIADQTPLCVTYDTREESNQNLGIGLGCNGMIDVLLEPLDPNADGNAVRFFESLNGIRQPVALATIFSGQGTGERLLISNAGDVLQSTVTRHEIATVLHSNLLEVLTTGKSEAREFNTASAEISFFVELIQPAIRLTLFGGGFDARPVSDLAKTIGWEVTVTDECVAHIAPAFFPNADQLSLCHREAVDREISVDSFTACVLMSHNYEYDRDILRKLLSTDTPYIGILGPRKRFDRMLEEFAKEGIRLSDEDVHRIHSPVGMDIGAEAPDEIALAIVAEIQAKFSGRSGGYLKYRTGPIHAREAGGDQVFKQVYLNGKDESRAAEL